MLKVILNQQLDNIESDFHAIFIENTVLTVFSGRIQNPMSVWYYYMPFFSNVETQVLINTPQDLPKEKLAVLQLDLYVPSVKITWEMKTT